ncbi:MAG: four helix bundle protein [Chlamydiota bacterium]
MNSAGEVAGGQSYKDLIAWQKAMDFVAVVYTATKHFPKDELYCLTSQLRRSALSIPSNIAEGQGRLTAGEFRQFLGHARGSLLEAETQIEVARKLNYLTADEADNLLRSSAEVGKVLNGLLASI